MDGRTLTGPSFVDRFGLTFGARVDNSHQFPNGEIIAMLETRPHISAEQWISGCRRFLKPLDSLSHYLSRAPVVLQGIGFRMECLLGEAVLIITDVFLLSTRPGRPISGLTEETSSDMRSDTESTASSIPSWIDYGRSEEEN